MNECFGSGGIRHLQQHHRSLPCFAVRAEQGTKQNDSGRAVGVTQIVTLCAEQILVLPGDAALGFADEEKARVLRVFYNL